MNPNDKLPVEVQPQNYSSLLDVLIRAGLILGLAILCFQVFSPFLTLMMWALILAVTLYPAQQFIAAKLGGKQGRAATLLVLLGIVVIVVPTAVLMSSLGDSIHDVGQRRAERHARDSGPARIRCGLARGRPEGACAMVAGVRRSSCARPKHAAEDR